MVQYVSDNVGEKTFCVVTYDVYSVTYAVKLYFKNYFK